MKQGIHPKYFPNAVVTCATCGTTWTVGSTRESIHTDLCFNCHPFYTGEQRIVDTEGQVDRFIKKLDARAMHKQQEESRKASRTSPELAVTALNLGVRAEAALAKAGVTTVGQIMDRLGQGDDGLLAIEGFGRKSLADTKKRLRSRGFELPSEAADESASEAPASEAASAEA